MYKLTVVGGPIKGQSYQVKDGGETSIGRVLENDIVLQSQKVSKRHCVLVVDNTGVMVKDAGSSNGTFVNGVLTKLRKLMPGDRVSVGEFVLELTRIEAPKNVVPLHPTFNLSSGNLPASGPQLSSASGHTGLGLAGGLGQGLPSAAAPPKDLKEKVKFYFDQYVINFVYNLNEKHEWRSMMVGMFAVLVIAGACLSVYPVLDRVAEKLSTEAEGRALLLARQLVDRNSASIFEKMETKLDVGFVEKEPGVTGAYLVDMEGRVMAPARKLNQYLVDPNEAAFSAEVRGFFAHHEAAERRVHVYGDLVGVAVPLKIFSPASGKNVTVALGLVFFDRGLVLFDSGTEALTYIQALILSAIVAVIVFFSLYRLTLRPLLALNDDIDQVLKGNASSVSRKFKMEELNPLIDVVNAALQRVGSGAGGPEGDTLPAEEMIQSVRFLVDRMSGSGAMVFGGDRKILHVSPFVEEIAGIRADASVGHEISAVARDAAFVAFVDDILSKAPGSGQAPVAEDFEFSGTSYRMECMTIGQGGVVRAYLLTATKAA